MLIMISMIVTTTVKAWLQVQPARQDGIREVRRDTHLRPAVALDLELVVRVACLEQGLLCAATACHLPYHGSACAGHDLQPDTQSLSLSGKQSALQPCLIFCEQHEGFKRCGDTCS